MYSQNGLAIGSYNGNSIINISENAKLDLTVSGIKIVGIGSHSGPVSLNSSADINMVCSGAQAVGIGSLDNGSGSLVFKQGKINMKMRSAKNSCIGSVDGSVDVKIKNADIDINSEGDESAGIGDVFGSGNVTMLDSKLTLNMLAASPMDIGSAKGNLQLQGCSISSIVNEKLVSHLDKH
jgi:hypothetical protein